MSLDGKISSIERRQIRISGETDLKRVDKLRAGSDAIMVGVGTVLSDDPSLRVKSLHLRLERAKNGMPPNPFRIVADSHARTPPDARILGRSCFVAVSNSADASLVDRLKGECEILTIGRERVDLLALFEVLYKKGIRRLMVEGGATLNWSLIELGLVDEIYVFIGGVLIGGVEAPTLADGKGFLNGFPRPKLISHECLDDGVLLKWRFI